MGKHRGRQGIQPTYQRGSAPIDGIFISEGLNVTAGGYLPFGEGGSDHRALWVKINEVSAFGYAMEKVVPIMARRLTLEDPRVVGRWLDLYEAKILQAKLPQQAYDLQT